MEQNSFRDYYRDLGLEFGATSEAVKVAFRTLAKQHHPDKSGTNDTTLFRVIREAYEKLSDTSYKERYDQSYWDSGLQDTPSNGNDVPYSRTAQYEAEERARAASPPPKKPNRKMNEASWSYFNGKAYRAWQKRDEAYRARHPELYPELASHSTNRRQGRSDTKGYSHRLKVDMDSHPAVEQDCTLLTDQWRKQSGGGDYCIFCVQLDQNVFRCPGCEALACSLCLHKIEALEPDKYGSPKAKHQYRPSGG